MKALNRNSFIDSTYLIKTIIKNGISSIIYKIFQLENFQDFLPSLLQKLRTV